jgi:hypothetical protein
LYESYNFRNQQADGAKSVFHTDTIIEVATDRVLFDGRKNRRLSSSERLDSVTYLQRVFIKGGVTALSIKTDADYVFSCTVGRKYCGLPVRY